MRFLNAVLAGALACGAASASIFGSTPDLEAVARFPDDNPLSVVYNGQANTIIVKLVNHAKTPLSIDGISGAFREVGGKERHLANTTASKYSLVIPAGHSAPVDVPYKFWSELKPQDLGFVVYVDYSDPAQAGKTTHRAIAYDGSVTVQEPRGSWFDPQLLFLYPLVLAMLGLPAYWLYTTFIGPKLFPQKKANKKRTAQTAVIAVEPAPKVVSPSNPEEWIPEHHLRARRTVSGKVVTKGSPVVVMTSGDETSGNESQTPRRSGRANKGRKVA